jgi:hypothetical protein
MLNYKIVLFCVSRAFSAKVILEKMSQKINEAKVKSLTVTIN